MKLYYYIIINIITIIIISAFFCTIIIRVLHLLILPCNKNLPCDDGYLLGGYCRVLKMVKARGIKVFIIHAGVAYQK